ncbi:MAG: hypothetical protein ABIQ11_12455 [Saprospiraceae bacterium]
MVINSTMLVLLLASIMFISGNCNENCYKEVQFQLPIAIYPDKNVYHPGDTIWIDIHVPYVLTDQVSNENITVGPYPFKFSMNILEIKDTHWIDGFHFFQIIESIGSIDTFGTTFPRIEPNFLDYPSDGYQNNKFGIIPQKTALAYLLIFSKVDYDGDWSGVKHFPQNDCDYAIDKSVFLTNDGEIDYAYYLEKYPQTHNPGTGPDTIANLKNAGAFFIEVE